MQRETHRQDEDALRLGAIPAFPGCAQILVAPDFGDDDFGFFPARDDDVKVLPLVPITPHEDHLLKDHGRQAFLDYWDESGVDISSPRHDPQAS